MNQPSSRDTYRSAMDAAVEQLGLINEEAIWVSTRMHQLDALLEALKPFMRSGELAIDRSQTRKPVEPAAEEVLHTDGLAATQMVGSALPAVVPRELIESADPIQRRINSVLGLAFA